MKLSAFIIDDEPIYVKILTRIIANNFSQIKIVGHSANLDDSILLVNRLNPDILFLDVNLGRRKIFEVVNRFESNSQLIFMSSDIQYAANAFRYDAVDFVLKPIEKDVCISAISKVLNKINIKHTVDYEQYMGMELAYEFLCISYLDRFEVFKVDEILYTIADGRYTRFVLTDGRQLVSSKNLGDYSSFFDHNTCFLRISRSCIININYLSRVIKKDGMHCVFKNGMSVPVSRRKYQDISRFLNNLGASK